MFNNTWDANRICRLLGYTRYILVIIMVRERDYKDNISMILYITSPLLMISQDIQCITKKLYKLDLFLRKFKSFEKSKSFIKIK